MGPITGFYLYMAIIEAIIRGLIENIANFF